MVEAQANISWKRIMLPLFLGAILLAIFPFTVIAEAEESSVPSGDLTVPWEEFKRLLNLDNDQVVLSLSTFHKLLAQTTQATVPRHALQDGSVVLSRAAFRQLIDQMKPSVGPGAKPPFDYLMTKAVYFGKMQRQNTAVIGTFHVHVLSKDVYLKVPLLPQSIALEDVTVDGRPALVVSENGQHKVVLSTPGEHVIKSAFSVKSSLEQGPQKIDLMIQQTPITLLRLEIPLQGIEVEIPQAQQLITNPGTSGTVVSAAIIPGRSISVRWRDKTAVVEKIPPKLYSEVHQLVSIEDDVLKISSDLNYNILHSEIDRVRFSIPEGVNVLSVVGEGVGEWQEITDGDERLVIVPFTYGRKGAVTVRVTAEKPLSEEANPTTFSGLRAFDSVRETGFIGIEVRTSAEVTVTESSGLEPVAVPKLPQSLQAKAIKPLMHGFKYLKHPYDLVLVIRKHQKIAVPVATISSASAVTLLTEDGKIVHRLIYEVKNSAKQFLEIQIPENADIWTVFVDKQPVESAINGEGKLLVPLIRSRTEGNRLTSFPVEIVYCLVEDRFSALGDRLAMLPSVDLLVSQLIWSVYLPNDFTYIRFSSTLEKEKMIRALNLFAGAQRQYDENVMAEVYRQRLDASEPDLDDKVEEAYKGNEIKSEFRNMPLDEEQMSKQVAAELEFGRRMEGLGALTPAGGIAGGTGVLPIEIRVPTGGQVYRFARTIVRTEEPLTMRVSYGANWAMGSIKWVILVLIGVLLYLSRGMMFAVLRWTKVKMIALLVFFKTHKNTVKSVAQSVMTPFVLFGLLLPSILVSWPLTVLTIVLLWLSVVYQVVLRWQRGAQVRSAIPEDIEE
jgi:hypothetical protein